MIQNNNIIINKNELLMNRKFKSLTPIKNTKKVISNETLSVEKYFSKKNKYSPVHSLSGLNSRLDKSPTINVKKKKSCMINYSLEKFLKEIKNRLIDDNKNENNINNNKNINNKMGKEQIYSIQKIVNNNFMVQKIILIKMELTIKIINLKLYLNRIIFWNIILLLK